MQIPIIPFRGQKKPWNSIPRINQAHPLARGMVFYGYDTGGGVIVDLISGAKPSRVLTVNPSHKASPFGFGQKYPSNNGGGAWIFPILPAVNSIMVSNLYSIACAWYILSQPNVAFTCPFGVNDTGSTTANSILFGPGVDDMQWSLANTNPTAFTGNTVNVFHTIVGTNTSATTQNVYYNGALKTTSAITATFTTTTAKPSFNVVDSGGAVPGNGMDGWVYYGAIWNRTVTAAEARLIHDDPYCFLIYPEDEMFATLVGAGVVATSEDRFHQPWSSVGRRYAIIAAG